jgi:hypothetical protein
MACLQLLAQGGRAITIAYAGVSPFKRVCWCICVRTYVCDCD